MLAFVLLQIYASSGNLVPLGVLGSTQELPGLSDRQHHNATTSRVNILAIDIHIEPIYAFIGP
jgi:hypothetical protein